MVHMIEQRWGLNFDTKTIVISYHYKFWIFSRFFCCRLMYDFNFLPIKVIDNPIKNIEFGTKLNQLFVMWKKFLPA